MAVPTPRANLNPAILSAVYACAVDPERGGEGPFGKIRACLPQYSREEVGTALKELCRTGMLYQTSPSRFYVEGEQGIIARRARGSG